MFVPHQFPQETVALLASAMISKTKYLASVDVVVFAARRIWFNASDIDGFSGFMVRLCIIVISNYLLP